VTSAYFELDSKY